MTAQGKAAGALVTPTTARKNHDCTDHFTYLAADERIPVPIKDSPFHFFATRIELCNAALRVRGYQVTRRDDGSYQAVHQHRSQHLSDFPALEAMVRSLGANPYGEEVAQ